MEKLKEKRNAREQQKESDGDVQNVESVAEKIIEVEKEEERVIEVVKTIEVEKIVEVVKPCEKCLEACKKCAEKDDIIAEYEKKKEQLLFILNYVKESYDVLNKTVTGLQKTNSEREQALTMMNATLMSKQKAINFYIEESAKWKQELETEKIENERIRRLLLSYSTSDYLIDRVYPTVAGMEAFHDDKPKEKKDCARKMNSRNHSGDDRIKSFLLRGKGMVLEYFIQEKLEPVSNAMKLVTLHQTVRKILKQNREFLRN
uniref:Uncharacterized protein n=1 Tax=Helianthus annuus TaxID=4232 RepID=A0A251VH34_HELAN